MTTTIHTIQLDSELERSANLISSVTMEQVMASGYRVLANVPVSNAVFDI